METSKNHHVLLWKNILPTVINELMNALDSQSPLASPYFKILGKMQHLKELEENSMTNNMIRKKLKVKLPNNNMI
jgi:hypothetical protein